MIRRSLIIGLAIAISVFSVSCSSQSQLQVKKNVVVGAANIPAPKPEEAIKEEPKIIKLDTENRVEDKVDSKAENKVEDKIVSKVENNSASNKETTKHEKEAYLTFDDGPTAGITPEILDILKQHQVKATFFVIGNRIADNREILLREKNEGHAIGNHSFSHDYKHIYENPNNFVEDINRADEELRTFLEGYDSKLIRFPGGSFGKEREVFRQAITAEGYHFVDWNALNGDAEGKGNVTPDKLFEKLKATSAGKDRIVVLMHDAPLKHTTVQALPLIIEYLKSQGYSFKTLE